MKEPEEVDVLEAVEKARTAARGSSVTRPSPSWPGGGGGVDRSESVLSMFMRLFGRSDAGSGSGGREPGSRRFARTRGERFRAEPQIETGPIYRFPKGVSSTAHSLERKPTFNGDLRGSLHVPELRRLVGVSEAVAPGDVLVLDRSRRGLSRQGTIAGDAAVVGVVSADPVRLEGRAAVAVSGVVRCKVDADYRPIHAGDSLTVSPTKGHAMHSDIHTPGAILGRALEPLESGRALIKVLVTLR